MYIDFHGFIHLHKRAHTHNEMSATISAKSVIAELSSSQLLSLLFTGPLITLIHGSSADK